jgi:hypothetical protein
MQLASAVEGRVLPSTGEKTEGREKQERERKRGPQLREGFF